MDAEEIKAYIADINHEALFADGFDEALLGYVEVNGDIKALYDYEKMVSILVYDEDMNRDEAVEHLENNVLCAYLGDGTPAYATILRERDEE